MALPMTRIALTVALCLALLAGAVAPAALVAGERGRDQERERGDRRAHDDDDDDARRISLDEAVAQAERRYNARVVRAEEKRSGDRVYYRIRLLGSDGRVFEVTVDAGSRRRDD